ncbi:MAG TPA: hypothetical protein IAC74_02020 [Candidatus Aphodoplasma excrementigallinarum]|uniref:V-type ATP synthase subunit H n=1 Tax=Candidatus Aphodoplasma excrementigallinarum TaxID=2840673 RepID=A0A9D1NFS4_9FIRM|nr:hypothetical protein [Candidatus Aphodoplasma excrementigallinarum]
MQTDVIEKIRDAEAKANEIIRQASVSARETVKTAGKEAYDAELGVDALAQKEVEKRIAAAEAEAMREKEQILAEAKKEADAMDYLVRPKLDKAADFIIERIVG